MNAKILTLIALLSLAALAAGYPTKDDRTDMDALRLINKIAREQLFKQEKETADEQGMYNPMNIVAHKNYVYTQKYYIVIFLLHGSLHP